MVMARWYPRSWGDREVLGSNHLRNDHRKYHEFTISDGLVWFRWISCAHLLLPSINRRSYRLVFRFVFICRKLSKTCSTSKHILIFAVLNCVIWSNITCNVLPFKKNLYNWYFLDYFLGVIIENNVLLKSRGRSRVPSRQFYICWRHVHQCQKLWVIKLLCRLEATTVLYTKPN